MLRGHTDPVRTVQFSGPGWGRGGLLESYPLLWFMRLSRTFSIADVNIDLNTAQWLDIGV